jgi:hypothetical protein
VRRTSEADSIPAAVPSVLPIRLIDIVSQKRDYFRLCLRGDLEQALCRFADFKARLKTHGGDRVLKEVLIP